MARIGLSKPYAAVYNAAGSTVTYSGGLVIGKAVDLSIELDGADDNILSADNGIAETANTFSGGSFSLTTDELLADALVKILGVKEEPVATEGLATTGANWLVWSDEQATPYMGFGAIVKHQINNAIKWTAIILPKIKFTNPNETFTTQKETIEWGTPEISGNLMRSDAEGGPWKMISSPLDSEADAETLIKEFLNITETETV